MKRFGPRVSPRVRKCTASGRGFEVAAFGAGGAAASAIRDGHLPRHPKSSSGNLTELDLDTVHRAARLLENLALWIAERGKGRRIRTPGELRNRAKPPNRRNPTPEIWELGREVKLDPEVLDLATSIDSAPRKLWRVKSRFCVRGHWRDQACGPGRRQRRRTWIAPHWKGPVDGTKLAHLYRDEPRAKRR